VRSTPTAPVAAGSLIVGYAVAAGTGSRPLGGVVLLAGGMWCITAWRRRHGARTAALLAGVAFSAFVISHVLALAIGAWPSVLLVAAATALAAWWFADARRPRVSVA
jgi:CHASE2 domain-containing sensor protein